MYMSVFSMLHVCMPLRILCHCNLHVHIFFIHVRVAHRFKSCTGGKVKCVHVCKVLSMLCMPHVQ